MNRSDFVRPGRCPLCGQEKDLSAHGLCKECTFARAHVVAIDSLDGAVAWSYPPARGELRRRRHIAYRACPHCRGSGRVLVEERKMQGCVACPQRFASHPLRLWFYRRRQAIDRAAYALTRQVAEAGLEAFERQVALDSVGKRASMLRTLLGSMLERRRRAIVGRGKGNGKSGFDLGYRVR